jgi:hypothetical protein
VIFTGGLWWLAAAADRVMTATALPEWDIQGAVVAQVLSNVPCCWHRSATVTIVQAALMACWCFKVQHACLLCVLTGSWVSFTEDWTMIQQLQNMRLWEECTGSTWHDVLVIDRSINALLLLHCLEVQGFEISPCGQQPLHCM